MVSLADRPGHGSWAKEHALAVAGDNEVVVLACQPADVAFYTVSESVEDGLRTIRVEFRDTESIYTAYPIRLIGMLVALRRLRRSGFIPDVAHARVFYSGFAAQLLLGRGGTPVIVSEHYTAFPRREVTGVGRAMAKITFERAALVLPDSLDLGRSIRELGIRGRFAHIPNIVDTRAFTPRRHPVTAIGPGASGCSTWPRWMRRRDTGTSSRRLPPPGGSGRI